tara:strand:+ start:819 stop:1526 length:708 start_codon:yes stop_codon:yes gene_type:complete
MANVDFNTLTNKEYLLNNPIDVSEYISPREDMLREIERKQSVKMMIKTQWKQTRKNWEDLQDHFLKGHPAKAAGWKKFLLWCYADLGAKEYGFKVEDVIINNMGMQKISAKDGAGDAINKSNGEIAELKASINYAEGCPFYALRVRDYHPVDIYLFTWYACLEDELWWILVPKPIMDDLIDKYGNVMANTEEHNKGNKNKEMRLTIERDKDCYKELMNYRLTTKEVYTYCQKGTL